MDFWVPKKEKKKKFKRQLNEYEGNIPILFTTIMTTLALSDCIRTQSNKDIVMIPNNSKHWINFVGQSFATFGIKAACMAQDRAPKLIN